MKHNWLCAAFVKRRLWVRPPSRALDLAKQGMPEVAGNLFIDNLGWKVCPRCYGSTPPCHGGGCGFEPRWTLRARRADSSPASIGGVCSVDGPLSKRGLMASRLVWDQDIMQVQVLSLRLAFNKDSLLKAALNTASSANW